MSLYLGEEAGARVIRYGVGISQLRGAGEPDYQLDVTFHPLAPGGDGGHVMFREAHVVVTHTNAVRLGVTPIVDGIAQPESEFSLVGAATGATVKLPMPNRGTRCALRVRTLDRAGDVAIDGAALAVVVIRRAQ